MPCRIIRQGIFFYLFTEDSNNGFAEEIPLKKCLENAVRHIILVVNK